MDEWIGWVGVVGTLLGAIVGAGVTLATDWIRRRHEDRHRFADVKRTLYGEYYRLSQEVGLDMVMRMHELHEVFSGTRSTADVRPLATVRKLHELQEQMATAAPDDVHDAAWALLSAISSFREFASVDPTALSASPWDKGDASIMWRAHDRFITLARRDLGVGKREISNE